MRSNDVTQITIYTNTNMGNGFSDNNRKEYAISIDCKARSVQYDNVQNDNKSFRICNYSDFDNLISYITDNIKKYVKYCNFKLLKKMFSSASAYSNWRNRSRILFDDIRWRASLQFEDGSMQVFISDSFSAPAEIENIFKIIKNMI